MRTPPCLNISWPPAANAGGRNWLADAVEARASRVPDWRIRGPTLGQVLGAAHLHIVRIQEPNTATPAILLKSDEPTRSCSRYGDVVFRLNGRLHRVDGPAWVACNGDAEWRQAGLLHRVDGPAMEFADLRAPSSLRRDRLATAGRTCQVRPRRAGMFPSRWPHGPPTRRRRPR